MFPYSSTSVAGQGQQGMLRQLSQHDVQSEPPSALCHTSQAHALPLKRFIPNWYW